MQRLKHSLADQPLHRHPYHLEHHPNPVGGRKSDVTSWKQPENIFVTTTFKHQQYLQMDLALQEDQDHQGIHLDPENQTNI